MPISYDSKKLSPAPMIAMQKSYVRTGDGKKVGATFTITLNGEILPFRGSPALDGSFTIEGDDQSGEHKFSSSSQCVGVEGCSEINDTSNMTVICPRGNTDALSYALMKKTEAIRELFSTEGKLFKIVSWWNKEDLADVDTIEDEQYLPAISGYPRIQSVNFDSNYYNKKVPYTITLELDELMGMDLGAAHGVAEHNGSEDFKNAYHNIVAESGESFTDVFYDFGSDGTSMGFGANDFGPFPNTDRVYLSDVTENWSFSPEGRVKGADDYDNSGDSLIITKDTSQIFSLSHEVSAVGKRAYGPMGLVREPWENARIWVESRLGLPSGTPESEGVGGASFIPALDGPWPHDSTNIDTLFTQTQNGFVLGIEDGQTVVDYAPYNYSRTQNIGKTNGNYSISEKWILAKAKSGANVIEKIGFNVSSNTGTSVSNSVVVNGDISGLETPKDRHIEGDDSGTIWDGPVSVHQTKRAAAEERFNALNDDDSSAEGIIPRLALSKVSGIVYPYTSKSVSKNTKNGVITFSYTFNDRVQHVTGSISETVQIQKNCAMNKYATIEVPFNSSGPRIWDLKTRDLNQATVSIQVVMGEDYRSAKPYVGISDLWETVWDGTVSVAGVGYTEVTYVIESEAKQTWDPVSGRYSKTKTYQWDGCDCADTVTYT